MSAIPNLVVSSFPNSIWERTCPRNFVAAFLAFTLLVTGCSRMTEENRQKIQNGMTTDEVKSILGSPTTMDESRPLDVVTLTNYSYVSGGSEVKIKFVDDKVIGVKGDFK